MTTRGRIRREEEEEEVVEEEQEEEEEEWRQDAADDCRVNANESRVPTRQRVRVSVCVCERERELDSAGLEGIRQPIFFSCVRFVLSSCF